MTKKNIYRSNFEELVANTFDQKKIAYGYETTKLKFIQPPKNRAYTPDFELWESGVFIETKGRLTASDREKMLLVKQQHPEIRIILLFQRASNPIRRGSNTTYAAWCEKNGFDYIDWQDKEIWKNLKKKIKE